MAQAQNLPKPPVGVTIYQTFTSLQLVDPCIYSSEYFILITFFPQAHRVTEWRTKVNMFAQEADMSRSEVYQGE